MMNKEYRINLKTNMLNSEILEVIIKSNVKNYAKVYNHYICINEVSSLIRYDVVNDLEEKIYYNMSKNERIYKILENYSVILSFMMNEMINKDVLIYGEINSKPWIARDLSQLYNLDLTSKLTDNEVNNVFSSEREKKLNNNVSSEKLESIKHNRDKLSCTIIVSTIIRDPEIYLYSKLVKENYPEDLKNNINFTKGYKICVSPNRQKNLSDLKYARKVCTFKPQLIRYNGGEEVSDFICNNKYTQDVWIRPYHEIKNQVKSQGEIKKLKLSKEKKLLNLNRQINKLLKIECLDQNQKNLIKEIDKEIRYCKTLHKNECYKPLNKEWIVSDDFLNKKVKFDLTEIINWLNSTALNINIETWNVVKKISEYGNNVWRITPKNKLINNKILDLSTEHEEIEFNYNDDELNFSLDRTINDASSFELTKSQIEIIINNKNIFYIGHKIDSRCRIYAYPWPLNYQLSHVARGVISVKSESIYTNTIELLRGELIKWGIDIYKALSVYQSKIHDYNLNKELNSMIPPKHEGLRKIIEKEAIVMLAVSMVNNVDLDIEERFKKAIEIGKQLQGKEDIILIEYAKKNKIDDKNLYKFINYIKTFEIIKNESESSKNNVDYLRETVYLDASSNSLQMIAYRMFWFKSKLMQQLNIYYNETEYDGIYSCITDKFSKLNHKNEIKRINSLEKNDQYQLTIESLLSLNGKEHTKRRLMPACYGKTQFASIISDEKIYKETNVFWNEFSKKKKDAISIYYWKTSEKLLKDEGFDLKEYMKLFTDKLRNRYWFNDIELPIIINNEEISKRDILREEKRKKELKIKIIKNELSKKECEISILLNIIGQDTKNLENEIESKNRKIANLTKEVDKIDKKLVLDELIFDRRVRISIKKDYYNKYSTTKGMTIRVPNHSNLLSKAECRKSFAPSSIHSFDSAAMFYLIIKCKKLGIRLLPIHDSVGCELRYAPIVRLMYIKIIHDLIERSKIITPYPFTDEEYNKYKNNKINITKMINSLDLFRI